MPLLSNKTPVIQLDSQLCNYKIKLGIHVGRRQSVLSVCMHTVYQHSRQSGTGSSWRVATKSLWSFIIEYMGALELCQTSIPALDLSSSEMLRCLARA